MEISYGSPSDLSGLVSPLDFSRALRTGYAQALDVRTRQETGNHQRSIPGAINWELDAIRRATTLPSAIDWSENVLTVSNNSRRAAEACSILRDRFSLKGVYCAPPLEEVLSELRAPPKFTSRDFDLGEDELKLLGRLSLMSDIQSVTRDDLFIALQTEFGWSMLHFKSTLSKAAAFIQGMGVKGDPYIVDRNLGATLIGGGTNVF